jgi:hypothetical protein
MVFSLLPQTLKYLLKCLFGVKHLLFTKNVNLSCNNLYLNYNIWYCILMCVDCILTSPRIAQADPGR